jgi:hypothetical protein
MREDRNVDRILMEKPQGKVLFRKPMHTYDVSIKMDVRSKRMGVSWIYLAMDRDKCCAVVNNNGLLVSIKCVQFIVYMCNC